jgi:putative nucleotidyltransferase with HDIG domain
VSTRKGLILVGSLTGSLLAGCAAAALSEQSDWQPWPLVVLLFVLAVTSDLQMVEFRAVRISGSFLSVVLAMVLLGPAPAVALGAASAGIDAIVTRRNVQISAHNVMTWVTFPLIGALLMEALVGDTVPTDVGAGFYGAVLLVFMVSNVLNFVLVILFGHLYFGANVREYVRAVYFTVLPSEFATGMLTAAVAFGYAELGITIVWLAAIVLVVFQYLIRLGVKAYERGEELGQRTRELASLQVGLLSTVLQTLSMRDAMTARHSAAVARYSREVAHIMGLPERELELIHTAALLHDIGKFIFPDSILLADRKLTDEEWEIVKLHPEQGAKLVERIEGYGPAAEIIHSHHERYDGRGYPSGLSGTDIPLGSRIIAAADTYDVMTSRDSYRRPVSSEAALAELQRVAGSQLDPEVVDVFVAMILEKRVAFRHADEADFERELAFERRVEDYARPRVATA